VPAPVVYQNAPLKRGGADALQKMQILITSLSVAENKPKYRFFRFITKVIDILRNNSDILTFTGV
jgi:hypothetical protein